MNDLSDAQARLNGAMVERMAAENAGAMAQMTPDERSLFLGVLWLAASFVVLLASVTEGD